MITADEQDLIDQLKSSAQPTIAKTLAPAFHNLGVNSPQMNKSSESGHSNSPHLKNNIKYARIDPGNIIRRRQRLSTISSDHMEFDNDSPRHSYRGRRKSSNFDMLTDPFKYQDIVN